MVEFDWDPDKAITNRDKHKIRFEDAEHVFFDPYAVREPNCIMNGEERWQITGMSKTGVLLRVIYTIRDKIRIISARLLTPAERRKYANHPNKRR